MDDDKEKLSKVPVKKLLFKLALPTITAQIINMLYNVVDRIYIGHMRTDGAAALTGVGVCLPVILIVTAFAALVGYGGAPKASMALGAKQPEKAEAILGNCFTAQIIVSIILTALLLIFDRPLLLLFGASENTIGYALKYLDIYAMGTIFVQLTIGMNAFITVQGFAKTGMLSVLIGAVSNIILDPILIYGFKMGVAGAAIATIASQAISCVWVICFLCGKKTYIRIRPRCLLLRAKVILPCIALGAAPFIMQSSESVISVCFNASLLKYGGDTAVGAMTILSSVMQGAMLPLMGLGQGAQPIMSYNYGANNYDRIRQTFRLLLKISLCYSAVLWALVMLFPRFFAGIFTNDTELLAYTGRVLRIYAASLGLFGIQTACQMALTSLGRTKASVTVAVVRKFILLIPLIFILPHIFTSDRAAAVYTAEPVADLCAVIFTSFLFAHEFKKTLGVPALRKSAGGIETDG